MGAFSHPGPKTKAFERRERKGGAEIAEKIGLEVVFFCAFCAPSADSAFKSF
jgi:hypothetical protein